MSYTGNRGAVMPSGAAVAQRSAMMARISCAADHTTVIAPTKAYAMVLDW